MVTDKHILRYIVIQRVVWVYSGMFIWKIKTFCTFSFSPSLLFFFSLPWHSHLLPFLFFEDCLCSHETYFVHMSSWLTEEKCFITMIDGCIIFFSFHNFHFFFFFVKLNLIFWNHKITRLMRQLSLLIFIFNHRFVVKTLYDNIRVLAFVSVHSQNTGYFHKNF